MFEQLDAIEKKLDKVLRILETKQLNTGVNILDSSDLCRTLKCNSKTLRRYIKEEGLKVTRVGNKIWATEESVKHFLNNHVTI